MHIWKTILHTVNQMFVIEKYCKFLENIKSSYHSTTDANTKFSIIIPLSWKICIWNSYNLWSHRMILNVICVVYFHHTIDTRASLLITNIILYIILQIGKIVCLFVCVWVISGTTDFKNSFSNRKLHCPWLL